MAESTADQGWGAYGADLITHAHPHDPYRTAGGGPGDPTDPAVYVVAPGVDFLRPWIAVRNGGAFQWPLGMEGFQVVDDPTLGIHKYIGDNDVVVDVIHAGEEHFTLTGAFIGDSAPTLLKALRAIVKADSKNQGKVLYLPEILAFAQNVEVVHSEFSRDPSMRGRDCQYTIEFVRMSPETTTSGGNGPPGDPPPNGGGSGGDKGKGTKFIHVDAKHNTLRKIALWKFGSAKKWRVIYDKNDEWFVSHKIPLAKAPDYRLPKGLKVYL